jgi:hypothetical protein
VGQWGMLNGEVFKALESYQFVEDGVDYGEPGMSDRG